MVGKVGRPRKDGVVSWTEKEVWQPFWEGVVGSLFALGMSFIALHFVEYVPASDVLVQPFAFVLMFICLGSILVFGKSLFNTERLKVVKE